MNACKIGVNLHTDEHISLEPRMHIIMACRIMVMSEPLSHNDFLKPGVHYVEFIQPEDFLEKLQYYLVHDEEREKIALNAFSLIQKELSARVVFPMLINFLLNHHKPTGLFRNYTAVKPDALEGKANQVFESSDRLNKVFGMEIETMGLGQFLLKRYRLLKDSLLPSGMFRRTIYERFLWKIKELLGIHPNPLGETILRRCQQIKESILPFNSKYRAIYEKLLTPVKKLIKKKATEKSPYRNRKSLKAVLQASFLEHNINPKLKPNIAFIIPSQSISGGTMVICQHANRLIKKGYSVILFDNSSQENRSKLDWFPDLLPKVIPINKIIIDCYIDIVIATHWNTAFTAIDFPARRKVYFVQSDETRFNPPGSIEAQLSHQTYTFDFEFVVIARWLQKWLKDNFGKNAYYVPNGLDTSLFYPDKPLEPKNDKLRVLLEGPIDVPFKGMREAFQVVDRMDCEVWCVSSSGRPKHSWHCDKFFEKVPVQEMRRIYSSCDVLLKMSKVEGLFMPPLEMMACGGTVVTNKVTGYDEYIIDGYNGLVVEQGDIESARTKLSQLNKDRTLLKKLIQGGLKTAKNWSWEESNKRLEELICSDNFSVLRDI